MLGPGGEEPADTSAMDLDAERERLQQEIEELERSLGHRVPSTEFDGSGSSLESGSDYDEDEDDSDSDIHVEMDVDPGGGNCAIEDDANISLPQTPETCLQMNLVYQEVIQEKIEELNLFLARNKEQQEKITWELAGKQGMKSSDGKTLPANMYLGHFMKPYFKDKTTGVGPPANADTREKAMQGIKSFEELITIKWKSREKLLLRQSVVSDQMQRLLQPKLLKLDYLNDKREKARDEMGKQILTKQIQQTEQEIIDINQLPEEALLGNRDDEHDWDKIANINFEGTRNATELRKYWQNSEHPSINKDEWSQEEIARLMEIAAQHNLVDWQAIAQELETQRSAFQCLQKFQAYNKSLKKSEWTPEEDQMLLRLVQEMRVGEHIPYRKIAYYMEGRDSTQLIYRWTKRVDPTMKRGAWTPEEDALLLKAVAKYGEQNWYKIRAEVPGRSDNQCRDRYLHALHHDIKKGKWSKEEERSLIELTEKYGVGHWAQIASQLPHRSGTQCLSKWKVLLGFRRNRRRKQKRSGPSSSSEDSDLDLGETSEEEEEPKTRHRVRGVGQWQVPRIDLWIPTGKDLSTPRAKELASVTLLSRGFDENRNQRSGPGAVSDRGEHCVAGGLVGSEPRTLPLAPAGGKEELDEGSRKNSGSTKDSWKVSLAYVKSVLRRNCYELQRRNREISRKKRFASNSHGTALVLPARTFYKSQKGGLWKTTLYRRLMMAVTPWAGSMVQAWALRVKAVASCKSKVEFISKQLQGAHLTSTPLFTLFIQLFHIDVDGCMKVIQKRKSRQLDLIRDIIGGTEQASPVQEPLAQPSRQMSNFPSSKKLIPLKAKEGPHVPANPWKAFLAPCPPPKPKTVSELLREKRLREAKTRRMEQRKVLLSHQLFLPPSVVIQQSSVALHQAGSGSQAAGQLGPPNKAQAGLLLSPVAAPVGSSGPSLKESTGGSQERELSCKNEDCGSRRPEKGQEAPAVTSHITSELPPTVTVAKPPLPVASENYTLAESGAREAPPSLPAFCALGPLSSQQSPVTLVPTLMASQPAVPKQVLPISWVVTPQGLVPLTLFSIPSQGVPPKAPGAAPNPGPAAEAALGKAPASNVILAETVPGALPSGAQVPLASSSSPQREGASRPPDSSPALAAATHLPPSGSVESQSRPHACPLAPPISAQGPSQHPDLAKESSVPLAQPHHACPAAPLPQAEKIAPDYSFVSLEGGAVVKEWAKGRLPVGSSAGDTSLPYLPPFLCSLRTLSALLLNKEALEQSAASLTLPGVPPEEAGQPRLDALRAAVRQRLKDNPAYQLLRARFLAALTFPAALAALPPSRVLTTLSGASCEGSQNEDSCLEEEEEAREPGRRAHSTDRRQEEPSTDSADSDHLSEPGVRRSTRLRKRRRQQL